MSLCSFAQDNRLVLKATMLIDPDLRLLYIGVDNQITIENCSDTNIFLRIDKEDFHRYTYKNNKNQFLVRVNKCGLTTIKVLKKTSSMTILIDTFNFVTRKIPDPKALFGNLVDSTATVEALLMQDQVNVLLPCFHKINFRIICFTMATFRRNGMSENIWVSGNVIDFRQKKLIMSLKPGDLLWIVDIKCNGSGGCTRTLSPVKIRVVNR